MSSRFLLPFTFAVFIACGNVINDGLPGSDGISDPEDYFSLLVRKSGSARSNPVIDSVYSDSGRFVSGSVVKLGNENIWLARIGSDSVKEWEGVLGSSCIDRIRRLRALDGENVLLLADRLNPDLTYSAVLALINLRDGIRWQHCIGDNSHVYDAAFTDDGCIIAAGDASASADENTPLIMKIDIVSGSVLWCMEYSSSGYQVLVPQMIIRVPGQSRLPGQYLLAGSCVEKGTGATHAFYVQLDTLGGVTASRYVYMPGFNTGFKGFFITGDAADEKKDKKILSMLRVSGDDGTDERLYTLTLDEKLEITKYRYDTFNDYDLSGRLVCGLDGEYYFAGLIRPEAGNGLFFLRYNKNGNLKDVATRTYNRDLFTICSADILSVQKDNGIDFVCASTAGSESGYTDIFFDRILYEHERVIFLPYTPVPYNSKAAAAADTFLEGDLTINTTVSVVKSKGSAGLKLERML